MAGSTYGNLFQITTWGESHGKGIGVVVDGCPAGLALSEEDIQSYLNRRKPGQSRYTTARNEADAVQILSGIFEGKTTGTPISLVVFNQDQHSRDYSEIAEIYRPGHADMAYDKKYGFRDYRGGGRSSGRETIGRVAAGAIAAKILKSFGVELLTYTKSIGPVSCDMQRFDPDQIMENPFYMPDAAAAAEASAWLEKCMQEQDSSGGTIECIVKGVRPGVGEPVFDKLDACLAKALFSIGAVKGVEIGDGFLAAGARGSENNDPYTVSPAGETVKLTNHSGGILGGISDGSPIVLRAAIKPTPSIAREQSSVTRDGQAADIRIKGRHDPVIVPRAVVVVEAMVAVTLLDLMLAGIRSNMDNLVKFFRM